MDCVAIVCYDGFDELDAIGPFEVFQNARRAGADWDVSLRTLTERDTVTASHGLTIEVDGLLSAVSPDLLLVPGGGWNAGGAVGARGEASRGALPAAIADVAASGATVAGVCTGGMLIERAGLLDGRPAVTHGGALQELRESAATVVDARVVDDGDVLTAGGVTSGLDLAVHLVEREWGAEIAETVRTQMEYEPRGRVYTGGRGD